MRGYFIPNWAPDRGRDLFPSPFLDYASTAMPDTIQEALEWCEYIVNNNGIYRSAVHWILSYFITDIKVGDENTGEDEKKKYEDFLRSTIKIKKILFDVGMDYITYGNAFTSVIVPFQRFLYCPRCRDKFGSKGGYVEIPLSIIAEDPRFEFKWRDYQFYARCQNEVDGEVCGYFGPWKHVDRRITHEKSVKIKLWSPKEIEIRYDELSGDRSYIWKIPESYKRSIREGHLYCLERAYWEVIECVRDNKNLEFSDGVLYHLYDSSLSGYKSGGWGISRILSNFRQVWYNQLLHRYNEAIAMDYIIPFRVITPAPRTGADVAASDPLIGSGVGFMSRVRAMLRQRRRNPVEWFTLPFPITYQVLGGEARSLAPYDLLDQGVSILLSSIGIPVELYRGSLSVQAAPTAIRLMEMVWTHLVHGLDEFLQASVDQISRILGWEPTKVCLVRPTLVDDLNDQMAKLQLMMGRQISQTTGLQAVGLDFRDEMRRILEEERFIHEQQAKMQEEMQQSATMQQMALAPVYPPQGGSPGAAAASGAPQGTAAAPGQQPQAGPQAAAAQSFAASLPSTPHQPTTVQELMSKAQTVAQQMLSLSEPERQGEMARLKQADPTLHALVKQKIQDIRYQARMAGGQQVLSQQFGGGGGG